MKSKINEEICLQEIEKLIGENKKYKVDSCSYVDFPFFVLNTKSCEYNCFYNSACILGSKLKFGYDSEFEEYKNCSEEEKRKLNKISPENLKYVLNGLCTNYVEKIEIDRKALKAHIRKMKYFSKKLKYNFSWFCCQKDALYYVDAEDINLAVNPILLDICLGFVNNGTLYLHGNLKQIGFRSEDENNFAMLLPTMFNRGNKK